MRWERAKKQMLDAFDVTREELTKGPVDSSGTVKDEKAASTAGPATRSVVQARMSAVADIEAFQAVNTAIFWHLLPSLDLSGPHSLRDERYVNSLVLRQLADGRSLLEWCDSFVDASSKSVQKNLRNSIGASLLKAGSSRAQLNVHAEKLFQHWSLIEGHDATEPASLVDYWEELLETLPAASGADQLLTALRTWFVGQVDLMKASQVTLFTAYDTGMDALLARAKLLGVPQGADIKMDALVFIGPYGLPFEYNSGDPAADD